MKFNYSDQYAIHWPFMTQETHNNASWKTNYKQTVLKVTSLMEGETK